MMSSQTFIKSDRANLYENLIKLNDYEEIESKMSSSTSDLFLPQKAAGGKICLSLKFLIYNKGGERH